MNDATELPRTYFDEDGRKIYLYSFSDCECSTILASYNKVTKEELDKEIAEAWRLWHEFVREDETLEYGKPFHELTEEEMDTALDLDRRSERTEEQKKQSEALRLKYPIDEVEPIDRVCKKFEMWHLEPDVGTMSIEAGCRSGCMGD